MVCTNCGEPGHNTKTCPKPDAADTGPSKRGLRDSPRTPGDAAKIAKLESLASKLSPKQGASSLPGPHAADSSGSASTDSANFPKEMPRLPGLDAAMGEETKKDEPPQTQDQKLDKLMEMMQRVAVKDDLTKMMKEVECKTKVAISEAVDPMKNEIADIKQNMTSMETRLAEFEKNPPIGGDEAAKKMTKKIDDIEKRLHGLKIAPAPGIQDQPTALVGLQGATSADEGKTWVKDNMDKAGIDGITQVYDKCKGEKFNGMVFVKFSSIEKRDAAITIFNGTKCAFNETRTFMNRDLAIQHRAKFSLLLNFKRLLIKWEFEKINFDDDEGILTVAGLPVLKAVVDVVTFKITWLDTKWAQWTELTSDPQFKELIKTAEAKLSKASKTKGKGKAASD